MKSKRMGAPQPAIAMLDLAAATAVDYDSLAKTIDEEFGRLDGVVHAAGTAGGPDAARTIRRADLVQGAARESDRAVHIDAGAAAQSAQVRRTLP